MVIEMACVGVLANLGHKRNSELWFVGSIPVIDNHGNGR